VQQSLPEEFPKQVKWVKPFQHSIEPPAQALSALVGHSASAAEIRCENQNNHCKSPAKGWDSRLANSVPSRGI
jgi:hypothetical protein